MFEVVFSPEAADDLERLYDHALARELDSETGDMTVPERALEAIRQACAFLETSPFTGRKVGDSPFVRELVVSFGATGYVMFYEIRGGQRVHVGAVRHQRESDYH
jgi:plasmid stabilization system protein ParE